MGIFMRTVFLLLCLATALPLQAANTWYVRPSGGSYGSADGTSYETAWNGFVSIVWASVQPGDTLYVAGTFHNHSETGRPFRGLVLPVDVNDHPIVNGTEGSPITIRGDYPGDPGVLVGAWNFTAAASWNDNEDGTYYVETTSAAEGAFEGTIGVDDYRLQNVTSHAEVVTTPGSYWKHTKPVASYAEAGEGFVRVTTVDPHEFQVGSPIVLSGALNPYAGTYKDAILVGDSAFDIRSTWHGNWATYPSYAGHNRLWYHPSGETHKDVHWHWGSCVDNRGSDYIIYNGLTMLYARLHFRTDDYSSAAVYERPVDPRQALHVTVRNCTFRWGDLQLATDISRNITIESNVFEEHITGIYVRAYIEGPANFIIRRNQFDCGDYGWLGSAAAGDRGAMQLQHGPNWLIEENHIIKATQHGIYCYRNPGNDVSDLVIRRNRIDRVGHGGDDGLGIGRGISMATTESTSEEYGNMIARTVIAYNVVRNCTGVKTKSWEFPGVGIAFLPGIPTNMDDRIWIVGNTVSGCNHNYYVRMYSRDRGHAWAFHNNISFDPLDGQWDGYDSGFHFYMEYADTLATVKPLMSHNCWYPDTSSGLNFFRWNNSTATNYADFVSKAALSGVTISGGFVADPLFVDAAAGILTLCASSPSIDTGVNLDSVYGSALSPASRWPNAVVAVNQEDYGRSWEIGAYVFAGSYPLQVFSANGMVMKMPNQTLYEHGEIVTLEPVADNGYQFVSWSGDLSGSSNPATLVMDSSKSVTAVFASNVHTLTVAASGGTVAKSPDKASYEYGESVTLTASADAGYSFTGWSGAASGTNSSVTIIMDGDKSVTASFAAISYTLSIAAANGSVVANPQKASYSYGESVSLQAVPGTGYHFTGWSGSLSGSSNPANIVMNADKSVTAAFAINTYTLTTSATNGSVVKSPQAASYTHGSTVSVQAVAAEGYEFAGWSGAVSGSGNPVEIVMDSSKSMTAAFTVKTYTLTTSATNGSVVRSPESATYAHGSTVSVQAVAAEGYHFTGWSGAVSGSSNPVSLVMDASKSVTAAFAANTYTLSISASNGTVTASPSQATYTHGEVVTLTAAPSTGYTFGSWSGDASGTAASTTVTMDGNKSVTAAFTLNTYTLSISSANGTVTRDPMQATYTHGQTVTVTAVPATGYSFSSWSGDLSGTVASATITMDGNKSVAAGFTINSYTLNTSGANGSITKNPDKSTYNHGETVTLQAVPAEGYNFVNWSGDLVGSTNPATLVMDSNKTVAGAFAANTYTLQTSATNGSVTRTPDRASYTHGETVTLTAVPATGYSFSSWSGEPRSK
jgi:uncharacterized repeat protein (TIGR02543 family)